MLLNLDQILNALKTNFPPWRRSTLKQKGTVQHSETNLASIHRITGVLKQCKALKLYYLNLDHPSHSPLLSKFLISIALLSLTQNVSYIIT